MLSPRTMSLRAKNRALLKALENRADAVNTSSEHGLTFDDDERFGLDQSHLSPEIIPSFHKHLSAEDLRPRKPLQWQNDCIPQHKSDCNMTLRGIECVNRVSSIKDSQDRTEKCFKKSAPPRPTPLGSTDDLRAIVQEIISDMKERKPRKTASSSVILTRKSSESRNSSQAPMKLGRGKSISLQQQRAAEAQMHAPTHSHLLSKCSCTDLGKIKAHPDSKYVVQLYGHRQRIPIRLKKQRYRADSISRPLRTVKWADTDNAIFLPSNSRKDAFTYLSQPYEDLKASGDFIECHEKSSPRPVHSDCHESQSSFLDRVRTFRESHWDDCHASPRGDRSSEHECVHHYILNRRLFLEPVHTVNGESSCPVCTLDPQLPGHDRDPWSWSLRRPAGHPSKIMVTLPTVLLEDSRPNLKSNPEASVIRKKMREKGRGAPSHINGQLA